MTDINNFEDKECSVDDKMVLLPYKEKEYFAKLLSNNDEKLSNILLSMWKLCVTTSAAFIQNNMININIVCDDLSCSLISKIVDNIDKYNTVCKFKYFDRKLTFLMCFGYNRADKIIELLNDNFYTINDLVDSIFNMSYKVDDDIFFEFNLTSKDSAKLEVRSIESDVEKFDEIDISANFCSFLKPTVSEGNYRCTDTSLRKFVDSIELKRPIENSMKKSKLLKYNEPLNILKMSEIEKNFLSFHYSEGNKELKEMLDTMWGKDIATIGCCSGHYYENNDGVWNRYYGKAYFGILFNSVNSVILANFIVNKIQELKISGIDCFISTKNYSGFMDLTVHIPRVYSSEFFSILKKFVSKLDENTAIQYNYIVGLITELFSYDERDYMLHLDSVSGMKFNIDSSIVDSEEVKSLAENISEMKSNGVIEPGQYQCDIDSLSEYVKHVRNNSNYQKVYKKSGI